MKMKSKFLEYINSPENEEEALRIAEELFRDEVQAKLYGAMAEQLINGKELAAKLGVTEVYIRQLFSDYSDLTVKQVARVSHALGLVAEFKLSSKDASEKKE